MSQKITVNFTPEVGGKHEKKMVLIGGKSRSHKDHCTRKMVTPLITAYAGSEEAPTAQKELKLILKY